MECWELAGTIGFGPAPRRGVMSAILLNSHSHRRRSDHFLCALLDCSLTEPSASCFATAYGFTKIFEASHLVVERSQPRPPSGSASVQRRDRSFRDALFYGESRRSPQGLGRVGNFDYTPSQYITFRWEFDSRAASVPHFLGRTESLLPVATLSRRDSLVAGFTPDLRRDEDRLNKAICDTFQGERQKVIKSS
jgi:hypothetical protein